jgi:hypothetical protein
MRLEIKYALGDFDRLELDVAELWIQARLL